MDWFEVANELTLGIIKGDTGTAIARVSEVLRSLPRGPFHQVLDMDFTNRPGDVANHLDRFLRVQKARFQVTAVYAETNEFDANPEEWYFNWFAYRKYGGHDGYDWLSDWDSDAYPEMTLTGLETLQAAYGSPASDDETQDESRKFCSLLVVCKFQDLIRRSVPFMRELDVPLLATGHDYDFVAEFRR